MENAINEIPFITLDNVIFKTKFIKTITCDEIKCSYEWHGYNNIPIKNTYAKKEKEYYRLKKIYDEIYK